MIGSTNGIRVELFSKFSDGDEWGVNMSIKEIAIQSISPFQLTESSYLINSPHPYGRNSYYVSGLIMLNEGTQIGNHRNGKILTEEVHYKLSFGDLTEVNAGNDYLKVYSGEGTSGSLLFSHSGGANEWPKSVVITSAVGITSVLQTDYKDPKEGIYMTVEKSPTSYRQDRIHTVTYNGHIFSTLADADINGGPYNSQPFPLILPPGWSVAVDDADARFVTKNFAWNTEVMVFSDGKAFTTATMGPLRGRFVETNFDHINSHQSFDETETSYYCNERMYRCQILIVKNDPASTAVSSSNDTNDNTTVAVVAVVTTLLALLVLSMCIYRRKVNACLDKCVYGDGGAGNYGGVHTDYGDGNGIGNGNGNEMVVRELPESVVKGPMSGGLMRDPIALEIGAMGFVASDVRPNISSGGTSPPRSMIAPIRAKIVTNPRDVRGAPAATVVSVGGYNYNGGMASSVVSATVSTTAKDGGVNGDGGGRSEWIEKFSTTYNRKFWKNTITGKSTWVDPFLPQPPQVSRVGAQAAAPIVPVAPPAAPAAQFGEALTILSNDDDEDDETELVL